MAGYVMQNTKVIDDEAVAAGGSVAGILDMERIDQPFNSSGYGIFPYHIEVSGLASWRIYYALSGDGLTYGADVSLTTPQEGGVYIGIFTIPMARFIKFTLVETGTVAAITTATVGITNKYFTYNI
jgi:hypothetical protein